MPIALIIPSFTAGGAERVMATLANHFQKTKEVQVHLIILTGGEVYYELDPNIIVHQPLFEYKKYNRFRFTLKILSFLRQTLREVKPYAALSFGGKYNAFVLLASIGLGINVFISERSRPGISYGRFLDVINPWIYRWATGIIAQTKKAEHYLLHKTKHKNIRVIGNPVKEFTVPEWPKKKVILNVGRFISSKHQDWLVDYFNAIETADWELWFLGDGPHWEAVKQKAKASPKSEAILFLGNQKEIENYYAQASIFAFPSTSEGFPNALGEAQRLGCACIAYDCDAGPSDLITNGKTGFLIPLNDHQKFKEMLSELLLNSGLRATLAHQAMQSITAFNEEKIVADFMAFIYENSN
ncbi:glycosyltransferase [Flavobacterium sp.]|uniref:glycosyltransferase n=1 Tax=Flavobacterium sp. TaxID=239 RepID=UPI002FDE74E3